MYAAIAKNGEPINGIKAGNRVFVLAPPRESKGRRTSENVRKPFSEFSIDFLLKKEKEEKEEKKERKRKKGRGREYQDEIAQRVK